MKIQGSNNHGLIRPDRARETREPREGVTPRSNGTQPEGAARRDRVDISDAAKARLRDRVREYLANHREPRTLPMPPNERGAEILPVPKEGEPAPVHVLPVDQSDRLDTIRQRILKGAYDVDEVVAQVARRILERGDV